MMLGLELGWVVCYCETGNNDFIFFCHVVALHPHCSYGLSLKLTTLLMSFIRRLKGGFELMYVNIHNLTCYSFEGHANIYKCMRDDIPLICFGHCIFA